MEELSLLQVCLGELQELHPSAPLYLRGDFNVSQSNAKRTVLLNQFCDEFDLLQASISHRTYHHFIGNGKSDSNLDKLLFSKSLAHPEAVKQIHCKLSNPAVDSHHDLLISEWSLPDIPNHASSDDNIVAPKVENLRTKVIWSDSGIEEYQKLVVPELCRIQDLWHSSSNLSRTSLPLSLQSTNNVLTTSTKLTNKAIKLGRKDVPRSTATPLPIRQSMNKLLKKNKKLIRARERSDKDLSEIRADYNHSRSLHRKLVREFKAKDGIKRDEQLYSIFSKDSPSLFKRIKSYNRGKGSKIQKLVVGNKTYLDEAVPDGFFDSISKLKSRDLESLENSDYFDDFSTDYQNILKICETGDRIPPISENDAFDLLQKMKPDVNDYYSVTPNHFTYAGPAGWKHFHLLLSALIEDVSNTDIVEINIVYACILFKGHNKDKTSDRSYRTISTCPVIAKALDLYIRGHNISAWNQHQAECQFQGEGSSHELAALLVTECIQHSLHHLKQPLFILYLDAKSAFDVVLKELLIKNLFFSGTKGHSLLYLNQRLDSRQTFIDWDGQIMGPVNDEHGLEQGGPNSSDLYKIFGKEQLETAHASGLGVSLGPLTVSGIGQADDTALVSNNIHKLFFLLHLTTVFCAKYHVNLCSEKTKLQVFHNKDMSQTVDYVKNMNPIKINDEKIEFTDSAEHVGMVRSVAGNLPTILTRITSHRKALAGVLHTGIARSHRGNPSASLRVQQLYGNPVLFSGLAPLVLGNQETNIVDQHHKETLRSLQRLIPCTPRSVTCFLAGSLPGSAVLHLRQFSIFGMITRLPNNILYSHAKNVYNHTTSSPKSWFHQIRNLCLQYDLPHPSVLLSSQLTKQTYKNLVKKHVIDYWETKLRSESAKLPSLEFFHPQFFSLTAPHPIWTTTGYSPTKVSMATVQAQMLSGRYRTELLCSNWSKNTSGHCLLSSTCKVAEDITHILKCCKSLSSTREKLISFTASYCDDNPAIKDLVQLYCTPANPKFCQFLLDCSTLPEVISSVQKNGSNVLKHLFNITRIWCYSIHRERLKILGRWNRF